MGRRRSPRKTACSNYCCFFCTVAEVSLSKAAYGTSRLLRALIPIYKIIMHRKEAKRPMKIPVERSEWGDGQDRGMAHTRSEVLVLIKQGLATIRFVGRARVGGVGGVVALDFHVDRVLVHVLVGLVHDRIGLGELSRRRDVEESVGRRNALDDVGKKAVWEKVKTRLMLKTSLRTIIGELLGAVRAQREHGELNIDNARARLKLGGV